MAYPTSDRTVDTAYGKRGQNWSCNENSSGGVHTGVDFAVASNTPLYAAIAGTIRHRQYGSAFGDRQFAISPSAGQPFEAGEVFYAHGNERLPDGTEVQVGDYVGKSGARGNVTGPHLHFEFHPSTKNVWSCSVHANPQPVLDHQTSSTPPPSTGGGDYPTPTSKKVYVSKLKYGQDDSDSVWYLQDVLNKHPLSGGATLPTTAYYGDMTDAEVIKCQVQHGYGHDPAGASYVGPSQAEHLFSGSGLTVVYDTGNPTEPDPTPPPSGQGKPPAPALMLPAAVWDPITNFPGLRPFTGTAKKITLHTTETDVKPNWEQQQKGIPHLTVDLDTGQRWQHLAFDIAAYTLSGGDHSPNSDSGLNIQIEIIGFTRDCPHWDYVVYEELRQILEWLCDNLGIPYSFPFGYTAPQRKDWAAWEKQSGILGHVHAPYNSHTDPTGLRTDLLLPPLPPEPEPEPEPPIQDYVTRDEWMAFRTEVSVILQELIDLIKE